MPSERAEGIRALFLLASLMAALIGFAAQQTPTVLFAIYLLLCTRDEARHAE